VELLRCCVNSGDDGGGAQSCMARGRGLGPNNPKSKRGGSV
jgi:hypothetical protein